MGGCAVSKLIVDVAAIHGIGRDVKQVSVELDDASRTRIDADFGSDAVHAAHEHAVRAHTRMLDGLHTATTRLARFTQSAAEDFVAQDAALAKAAG
jgi:hypothetical protein